jgi:hypothetical protein
MHAGQSKILKKSSADAARLKNKTANLRSWSTVKAAVTLLPDRPVVAWPSVKASAAALALDPRNARRSLSQREQNLLRGQ